MFQLVWLVFEDRNKEIKIIKYHYLSNGPFDHRPAGHTGAVDFLEVVVRVTQVTSPHFFADVVTGHTQTGD